MIAQIRGTLLEATPSLVVIEVGGMGLEAGISSQTCADLPPVGQEAVLFTRLVVREDAWSLFGFSTKEERAMFDRLVAISGVGAKLALAVLSKFSAAQLYTIVMTGDEAGMSSVPGVGKKTAQRLILELKGAFEKNRELASAAMDAGLPRQAQLRPASSSAREEAESALLSMGFTSAEIELALDGYDGDDMRVEQLLTSALRRLGMDA